jgi:hypothetical protein
VFEIAELDRVTMICHTNSKMKGYLLVLNVSNCYEVHNLYEVYPVFIDALL